ncbi:olfactory receptor 5AC1-like [Ostrea edulis]|uniref:olfactory receptor 5AC1-like n=1 Tax=Ostrea edulis TaxID=37623 RepID=UPI0024AFAF02|nr:olfactory receptor 5AC1-like [Ostrea edulis]XP_048740521.2 olfactory receptor 5AC1-like [Ostrea edulis]
MDSFEMNTTVYENALQKYFETSRHYLDGNTSNTDGHFNVFLNSTTNTDTSENGTQAVSGNNANVPLLFFTLDRFQSESSKIIAVVILVIGSLGLVGNICTILKIWSDKKFHTPTFAVIGCLAFADFLSIVRCYAYYFTDLFFHSIQFFIALVIPFETSYCSSLGHMILLFVVRYLITVHPLQSRIHLTTLVVILWSVTVWILSLILSLFAALYVKLLLSHQKENILEIYNWSLNLVTLIKTVFTFCTIITVHCLKMKSLRSSRVCAKTKRKMNLIITVILSVFLTSQTLFIVVTTIELLHSYGILSSHITMFELQTYFVCVLSLLEFVHYSCNPYIYFLISCCFKCKCICTKKDNI